MVWEMLFLLVILKIPIIYLCAIVWWAITSEPEQREPDARVPVSDTPSPAHWSPRHRRPPLRRGPDRSPRGRPVTRTREQVRP
ncbi:MAG: hypothetical protein ACR2HI_12895 [Gaiella sp.]